MARYMNKKNSAYGAKNYDIIFFVIIGIVIILILIIYFFITGSKGRTCEIKKDNKVYGEYTLSKNREIKIKENNKIINVVVIKDNEVYMKDADCPDKLCEKTGKISNTGETIVCLPNKIVVLIKGSSSSKSDALDSYTK